jgi:ArsR family transcriptional regulator
MHGVEEVSRLLDILGNRNRRRIIELLRQKPCFVTEISDTLTLSPKAVIEHLQMMEREMILSCQIDERRRKYYYLANDILVDVSLQRMQSTMVMREQAEQNAESEHLRQSIAMFGQMIRAQDQLINTLENLGHDIETKFSDIARNHKDLFRGEREFIVLIALSHESLTFAELADAAKYPPDELADILKRFEKNGIVKRIKDQYSL